MQMQMGDLECQGKAPHQQGELFLTLHQMYTQRTLEAGITFDFYITSVTENTQWKTQWFLGEFIALPIFFDSPASSPHPLNF